MIEPANITTQPELGLPDVADEGIEVEGDENLPDPQGDDSIIEPFDPTLIRVSSVALTVDLLVARLRNNEIDLAPDFQRRAGLWSDTAKSRLIESMLIKIPLPAFYMDATDEEKWLVVDGLQRLETMKRFVNDQSLRLTHLEFLNHLNGKTFSEMSRNFQRRILETQVTIYKIEKGTPSGVKFNIFRRINTGGLPLSSQEIRHALFQGPVTELLKRLAQSAEFIKATNGSIRVDRMADRECVLRFLAFALTSHAEYKTGDFDSFLNDAMHEINVMSQQKRDELEKRFKRAMTAASKLFGLYAFRKRFYARIFPINKPLFEAWSINLDRLTDQQISTLIERKSDIEEHLDKLLKDYDFDSAISFSTGDARKVRLRFGRVEQLIAEVLK